MKQVDMSEKAILSRLRQVDQLRELSLSLMKAKRLHDEKADRKKAQSLADATSVLPQATKKPPTHTGGSDPDAEART